MKQYKRFLINSTDEFKASNYGDLENEIHYINERTERCSPLFKSDIIVSFLKNHSIQKDWIAANKQLTELVTSKTIFTGYLEALFDSSTGNPAFRVQLESYLREKLKDGVQKFRSVAFS